MITVRMSEIERKRLMDYCRERDVRSAGIFDCRGSESLGCINVWSCCWITDADCERSELIGTITLLSNRVEIDNEALVGLVGLPLAAAARELSSVA
ncbi:hypothetical protein HYR54_15530 [Candidatus Acetothermia bacterium]|nr:hypothetical protein [Candidatus Acetothermia bacterium]MBI3460740.1 hypothetical protein [Candidatus Acetothermia bacterium]